ncbi:MAG: hypothetical protein KC561_01690, partial [Myxococcales bacterium]|nr:hypothetical protein [Myxococcales bacterium]
MADSGEQQNGTPSALEQHMLRHDRFASDMAVGGKTNQFMDRRQRGLDRVLRFHRGDHGMAARQLAIEVGMRYLPMAAQANFLPHVGTRSPLELYPETWRRTLDLDLLRLFADEQEQLVQAIARSSSLTQAARQTLSLRKSVPAAAQPRPGQARVPAPTPAVARAIQRLAKLSAAVEKSLPGVSTELQRGIAADVLKSQPAPLAASVWSALSGAGLIDDPAAAASQPGRLPRPLELTGFSSAVPGQIGSASSFGERSQLRVGGRVTAALAQAERSPYPSGMGKSAVFSRLISARPAPTFVQATGDELSRGVAKVAAPNVLSERQQFPGAALDLSSAPLASVGGTSPVQNVAAWIDDVGVDRRAMPSLSTGLQVLNRQGVKIARQSALLLKTDGPSARLLATLDRRSSGQALVSGGSAPLAPAGAPSAAGSRAAGRSSLLSAGLLSFDSDPSAPHSPSQRALRMAAASRHFVQMRSEDSARAGLPDSAAPGRVGVSLPAALAQSTQSLQPQPARSTAPSATQGSLTPQLVQQLSAFRTAAPPGVFNLRELTPNASSPVSVAQAPGASQQRTWQMFSPAKSTALSLLLSQPSAKEEEVTSARGQFADAVRASRLGLAITEGASSLADLHSEALVSPRHRRIATSFGTLSLRQENGGTRAMRATGLPQKNLVQLYVPQTSSLDRL